MPPQSSPNKELPTSLPTVSKFYSTDTESCETARPDCIERQFASFEQPKQSATSATPCCAPLAHCIALLSGSSKAKKEKKELEEKLRQQQKLIAKERHKKEEVEEKLSSLSKQHETSMQDKVSAEKEKDDALQAKKKAESELEKIEENVKRQQEAWNEEKNKMREEMQQELHQVKVQADEAEKLRRSAAADLLRVIKEKEQIMAMHRPRTFCDCFSYIMSLFCCLSCCLPRGGCGRRGNIGDCFRSSICYGSAGHDPVRQSSKSATEADKNENISPGDSMELINKLLQSEWPFISKWFKEQMEELAQPCLQELIAQYMPSVKVTIGTCNLGNKPMQLLDIKTENYKEFKSDNSDEGYSEIDNLQILGKIDFHSDAQMDLNLDVAQVRVSDIVIKGEIVIELVQLTHAPPWFSGIRVFSPNVPDVDLKVQSSLLGLNINPQWLKKTIIDAITRNVITYFAVLPNRFTINLADRIDAFALRHPAPQGVLRLAVMKAESLYNSQQTSWGWFRKSEAPTENTDPRAVVSLGAMSIETSKRDKTLNPDWGLSEIHDLVVTDKEKQKLRIVLRDANHGLFSKKESDFLGQVDVAVKDLTNCVDSAKVFQLSRSDSKSAGAYGQLSLKAQFRELADKSIDTRMERFLKMQEWDFGICDRTGVLLMADIFYASGLPPCEDKTLHWAEVKVSGHRRTKEEGPIETKTPEMPARTALQHGRELALNSFGPDLQSVLKTGTKDDLGCIGSKIWRKKVEISPDARDLEKKGSQLVDVVFDTPFSFLLDSVTSASIIEIAIFRTKKAGWRAKEGHKKECVGRIEGKIADLQNDGIFFTSLMRLDASSSASSLAPEEHVGQLRWRLQARRLMKLTPKTEEPRRQPEPFSFAQQCFRGIRPRVSSFQETIEEEEVVASQEAKRQDICGEEQKPDDPAAEAAVEKPVARSWWSWPWTSAPKAPVTAESATAPAQEDGVGQDPLNDGYASVPMAPAATSSEMENVVTTIEEPEDVDGKATQNSSSVSWLWAWLPGRGGAAAPKDSDKKQDDSGSDSGSEQAKEEDSTADTTLVQQVSPDAKSAKPSVEFLSPQIEASHPAPRKRSPVNGYEKSTKEKAQASRKLKDGRNSSVPPPRPPRPPDRSPQPKGKDPKARDKTKFHRSRSVSTSRAPTSITFPEGFPPPPEPRSGAAGLVRSTVAAEPLGESDSQALSQHAVKEVSKQLATSAAKAEEKNKEDSLDAGFGGDSGRLESSLSLSADICADHAPDAQNAEGASTSFLSRIVPWGRRKPVSSLSPSGRSASASRLRKDDPGIPTSNSAPTLSDLLAAHQSGNASEVPFDAFQILPHHETPTSEVPVRTDTLTSEVSAEEDYPEPPIFLG